MKRIACLVGIMSMLSVFSAYGVATINWGTTGAGVLRESDNLTPITGSQSDSLVGGFLQLIFVGADGLDADIYSEWTTPTGLLGGGNDEIIGSSWVGVGTFLVVNGKFTAANINEDKPVGSQFVIRFFEEASPNFAAGLVPTSGSYGYSSIFTSTASPDAAAAVDDFMISSPLFANLGPIPEPGTVALFGIGAVVLALRKRLKK